MCTGWNHLLIYPTIAAIITYWEMCTGWNSEQWVDALADIITYWEMCTGWNTKLNEQLIVIIITYWEMCTGWNPILEWLWQMNDYNLLGNVHWLEQTGEFNRAMFKL